MIITNYKEYDDACARRDRLQSKMNELNTQLLTLMLDWNQVNDEIEDYDDEQRALNE